MTAQNTAAASQAAMSREQLDFARQIYAESAPERAAASARATRVSDAQLRAADTQTNLTNEYADYQRNTFRPLEQGIVADAVGYDTAERRGTAANQAMAGIETSLAGQRASTMRDQERTGVNPNSGRIAAMQGSMDLGAAKLKAGAASAARTQVETIGQARKMDAANLGRGLASNQATSAGIALNAGNSSAANSASTGNITGQGAALMNAGFSGAQSGLAGSANTYGQISNIQNQANQASNGIWGALGSAAGGWASGGFKSPF